MSTWDAYLLLVLALVACARTLPHRRSRDGFADCVAGIAFSLSRGKRRRIEENVAIAFQGRLGEAEIRRVARGCFRAFWRDVFAFAASPHEKAVLERAQVIGIEHLGGALEAGNGAILWESSGFGSRNLAKQILWARGFLAEQIHAETHIGGFVGLHRRPTSVRRRIIRPIFERLEKKFVREVIYIYQGTGDSLAFTRILLDRLSKNAILCSAGDAPLGQRLLSLPFLEGTSLFATGMASLSRLSGAPILPMFCVADGDGPRLMIEAPIRPDPALGRQQALEAAVAQYVRALESYVRRYPEEYRVWHGLRDQGNGTGG